MKVGAFNETTAKNAVLLNDLATQMKLNIYVQDRLLNINCPTLIINGKDDFIVEEAYQLVNKLIVHSEIVLIEEAGHYPFIENKKDFFNELDNFIKRTTFNDEYK